MRHYRRARIGTNWNQLEVSKACKSLKDGGQGRNRTADASLFRAALYRLSYLAAIKDSTYPVPFLSNLAAMGMSLLTSYSPPAELLCMREAGGESLPANKAARKQKDSLKLEISAEPAARQVAAQLSIPFAELSLCGRCR